MAHPRIKGTVDPGSLTIVAALRALARPLLRLDHRQHPRRPPCGMVIQGSLVGTTGLSVSQALDAQSL